MREIYRILDANLNRAAEAARVIEDYARFALDDAALSASAKGLRSRLAELAGRIDPEALLASRDTPGDVGTAITSPTEAVRPDARTVVVAAFGRLSEALRSCEEYAKVISDWMGERFQALRYDGYALEQRMARRLGGFERFGDVRLYVLVTSSLCRGDPLAVARAAIEGGADCIQLREKHMPDRQVLELARQLRELTAAAGVLLIVNDRPDIAAIVHADGVHLGQDDLYAAPARQLLPPWAIVGKSTHDRAQLQSALVEPINYVAVGPMFATDTKDAGPVAGVELLRHAVAQTSIPVVPIGGINAGNVGELIAAGAERVAVCSAVIAAADPAAAAASIKSHFGDEPA